MVMVMVTVTVMVMVKVDDQTAVVVAVVAFLCMMKIMMHNHVDCLGRCTHPHMKYLVLRVKLLLVSLSSLRKAHETSTY